jgi:hypothetical protein
MGEKSIVRYLGYTMLEDGGRGFEFSVGPIGEGANLISIRVSADLFQGPDRIFIQEAAGICYETLRCRMENYPAIPNDTIHLNSVDVAQHRKVARPAGKRS